MSFVTTILFLKRVFTFLLFVSFNLYFIMLNVQQLSFSQIIVSFVVQINHIILTVCSLVSVDFIYQSSGSVSVNVIYHS